MFYIVCKKCQSEYRVTRHVTEGKNTDKEKCRVCGHKLISWQKSKMSYTTKLKIKRKMHLSRKKLK